MSGRKQHFIPQFLQKNFSDNTSIYVFHINRFYGVAIEDNWAQKDYYSSPNNPILDDNITKIESEKIVPILNGLKELENNTIFTINNDIKLLIKHFWARNKFIFKILEDELSLHIDNLNNYINDKNVLRKVANNIYIRHWKILQIKKITILDLYFNINNAGLPVLSEFDVGLSDAKNIFHNLAIENIDNEMDFLNSFKYKILRVDALIMPDVVFICWDHKNNRYAPFFDINTSHIVFPLSKNKLLLIFKECDSFNIIDVNKSLAGCAYNSFAIDNSLDVVSANDLQKLIRKSWIYDGIVNKKTKEEIINIFVGKLEKRLLSR